ncbi:formylglycine-generating enzyme family protein [Flavilitoribacter nigricans]|uniref:Uncharacterized protein n=1 Tax=Flavilitoribacter nigricans (strain ATCC 23147 / DSM 23189 / NBRC 102662 / NCIMB 1420 / SS-2) TaxID=1122177 RepID=A0A2D0NCT1_FLAN2|nr:SUMF1/EgtB/PvdO family nonheme iron enzyme [Flavilitoribacter nigricans]PHN06208.1 hypothetical protein CRP01_11540 [Flavilitoribacter nigricans DSM 23189 = NBRC 102662]
MQYRYPGARPFTDEDQELFFGRDRDIDDLTRLLLREKLAVLYARSGLGKSSLLQAGIVPRLLSEGSYEPYSFRFGTWQEGRESRPVQLTVDRLGLGAGPFYLDKLIPNEDSLWYHCKRLQLQSRQNRLIWLFDQFEEIFTYNTAAVAQFGDQLSDLLYQQIPSRFRDALEEQADLLTQEEMDQLYEPLEVHALFSIRADRLSLLDQLSGILPAILHQRYELKPLYRLQAEDAILNPAYSRLPGFATPPFDYTDEALDYILEYLTEGGTETIESFQLQIICQYAEQQISGPETGKLIAVSDLGDLGNIFKNYYDGRIGRLSTPEDQLAARKLIEEGLIFEDDERRLSLYEGQIERDFGVSSALLKELVDTHLLRSESDPRGGFVYELSHDTLVAPILQAKQRRRLREEEVRRKAELEEQARLLAEERRKRRKAILIGIGGVALALIAFIAMVVAFHQRSQAKASQLLAEQNREKAERSDEIAQIKATEAEDSRALAVSRANEAETARQTALAAEKETALQLARLQAANRQRVAKKLEEAQELINQLQFARIIPLLQDARELRVNPEDTRKAYLELIFFYTEAGRATSAYQLWQEIAANRSTTAVGTDTLGYLSKQLTAVMPAAWSKTIRDKYYPRLISVQGGSFIMGSSKANRSDILPEHEVQLDDFSMGATEVSVLQYYLYCARTVQEMPDVPGLQLLGDHPITGVSWADAEQYCTWLGEQTGRPIRLPTEAEWEYVARKGNYTGNLGSVAWFEENSQGRLHPVARKEPNALGFYDLLGNAQEWCSDWYEAVYYTGSPLLNPKGPENGIRKVLRGGSWEDTLGNIQPVIRNKNIPGIRSDKNGFRIVEE